MAVYKVIQDIEAEDKLLGPLTLKQFIYAAIVAFLGFINFRIITMPGIGGLRWLFFIVFLIPMLIFAVIASPIGRDQPTEVWLLSHVRFLLKPRLRVWNQTGESHLVTITAPKPVEKPAIKDLSQTEVRSRLKTLASTLDTRGWAFKNVAVNQTIQPDTSDRLVTADSVPQTVPAVDVRAEDDILDATSNTTAQKFSSLMQQKSDQQKQAITSSLQATTAAPAEPIVHFAPVGGAATQPSAKALPKIQTPKPAPPTDPKQAVKFSELAKSDELRVSSISQLANHQPDEVVIQLH